MRIPTEAVISSIIVVFIFGSVFSVLAFDRATNGRRCREQYGNQYVFRGGGYANELCVAPDGSAKFLK